MLEICLECYNNLVYRVLTSDDVLLTKETHRCGICGKVRRVVVITADSTELLNQHAPRSGSTAPPKALHLR